MKQNRYPAQVYEAFCPRCDARVEYPLFGSSFQDFGSFLEITSGTLVRLSLDAVDYQKLDLQRLLADVVQSLQLPREESQWIDQSKQLYCPSCKAVFGRDEARDNRICLDAEVAAWELKTPRP